jgi:hypothetical protein
VKRLCAVWAEKRWTTTAQLCYLEPGGLKFSIAHIGFTASTRLSDDLIRRRTDHLVEQRVWTRLTIAGKLSSPSSHCLDS